MGDYPLLEKAVSYCYDAISPENPVYAPRYVIKQCKKIVEIYEDKNPNAVFDFEMVEQISELLKIIRFHDGWNVGYTYYDKMYPYQLFFIFTILCVKHRNDLSKRYFNIGMLLIPRKAAKTAMVCLLDKLLLLLEDDYSEFYTVSSTGDLAGKVLEDLGNMIDYNDEVKPFFKVTGNMVRCKLNNNKMTVKATGKNTGNALKSKIIVIDEWLSLPNRNIIEAMSSSQYSVKNRLMLFLSTHYPDQQTYDEAIYAKNVLDGIIDDPNYFSLIFEPDNPNWWDSNDPNEWETVLKQVNPLAVCLLNDGISDNWDKLCKDRGKAILMPASQVSFLCKNLNIQKSARAEIQYIANDVFKECATDFKIDFRNRVVYGGLDLSTSYDITGLVYSYEEDGYLYVRGHGYIPQGKLDRGHSDGIDYKQCEERGELTIHNTPTVNYKAIVEDIKSFVKENNCELRLYVDPNGASMLMGEFEEESNIIVIPITQSNKVLSPLIKWFRYMAFNKQVYYERNSLLEYCNSNAATTLNNWNEERLVRNVKGNRKKIDLIVSLIFSLTEVATNEESWGGQA